VDDVLYQRRRFSDPGWTRAKRLPKSCWVLFPVFFIVIVGAVIIVLRVCGSYAGRT